MGGKSAGYRYGSTGGCELAFSHPNTGGTSTVDYAALPGGVESVRQSAPSINEDTSPSFCSQFGVLISRDLAKYDIYQSLGQLVVCAVAASLVGPAANGEKVYSLMAPKVQVGVIVFSIMIPACSRKQITALNKMRAWSHFFRPPHKISQCTCSATNELFFAASRTSCRL